MDGERVTGVWQVPAPFLAGSWRSAGAFLAASAEKSLDHNDCTPPFLSTAFPGHVRGMLLGEACPAAAHALGMIRLFHSPELSNWHLSQVLGFFFFSFK